MILLIACGNVLRRDDGAAIVLARRLRHKCPLAPLEIIECQQLTPELAPRLADPAVEVVIFTDAAVAADNEPPHTRLCYLSDSAELPPLVHHLGPAALLDFATRLYGRRPPAWLATLPAVDFCFGVGLSRRTRRELRRAEKEIIDGFFGKRSKP